MPELMHELGCTYKIKTLTITYVYVLRAWPADKRTIQLDILHLYKTSSFGTEFLITWCLAPHP